MISKLRIFILCVIAVSAMNSCMTETNSDNQRATYSGYVALEYTGNVIRNYSYILTDVYKFNEYYSQPTIEKRDSVDRLYFMNTKIMREANSDTWTLHNFNYYEHGDISINTNGKTINDDNAKWIISLPNYYSPHRLRVPEFEIEKKGDGYWHIKEHDNYNYEFDYSSEWDIRFNKSKNIVTIEGRGTLLSFESPKLKLDYTITEPLNASLNTDYPSATSITSGEITILATDVNKNITEETVVYIINESNVEISHKNNSEDWRYSILWGRY